MGPVPPEGFVITTPVSPLGVLLPPMLSIMDRNWELRWVHIPEGRHLSRSTQTPGADRDLLRDNTTKKLLGPTESRPASLSDLSPADDPNTDGGGKAFAAELALYAFDQVWDAYGDELTAWAYFAVRDKARDLRAWRQERRSKKRQKKSDRLADQPAPALTTAQPRISAAEFRRLLAQAAAAEAYAAEVRHALARVDVEVEEGMTPELRRSIDLALTQGFTSLDADSQETLAQYLLPQEGVSSPARPRNARRGYRIEQVASDDGPVKGLPAH